MRLNIFLPAILIPLSCLAQSPADFLDQGVQDFRSARYAEAVVNFGKAVDADPANVQAHLYLGTALQMQYTPGMQDPANEQFADGATAQFHKVLELEPQNKLALASMASLAYNQKKFDEAEEWNKKVIAVDPDNKEAYYTLGVIAWNKWLPVDRQARLDSGQRAEDVGPIGDAQMRASLRAVWLPGLDEGLRNMEHALQIDPKYSDAMAYLNLLIRYRADLDETTDQWRTDSALADQWMRKSLDAKKAASSGATSTEPVNAPASAEGVIRIGGKVQATNLITQIDPVYPPSAREARISGTVRFSVTIGLDGHVETVQLISGHPLLVQPAKEAVMQYLYKPTLLNGQAVTVQTTVDVVFKLMPM